MKLIAAIGDQVSPTLSAFAFACQTLFACSGLNRMLLDRTMFTKVATREKSENQKKKLHFRGTAIHSAETQEEKLSRARRKLEENNRGRRNRGWIKERMQTDSS
jgi:ubiquitin C-terminal hydrolase